MSSGDHLADEVLADRLGLKVREFRRYRARGLIAVEVRESEGCLLVTCRFGNRIWEGLVEAGSITFEQVRYLRGIRARASASK